MYMYVCRYVGMYMYVHMYVHMRESVICDLAESEEAEIPIFSAAAASDAKNAESSVKRDRLGDRVTRLGEVPSNGLFFPLASF
jgi:hypothetical protein